MRSLLAVLFAIALAIFLPAVQPAAQAAAQTAPQAAHEAAHQAAHQACEPLAFPPGADTTIREDPVPKNLPLCYDFHVHLGQTVTLRVDRGDDMILGLDSVAPDGVTHAMIDSQTAYTFKAEKGAYRVYVASRKTMADVTKTFALIVTRH